MYDNKTKLKVALNAEANKLLKNTQNSRCMYKECCNKPIDSHCYQKSMLEEKLSDKEGMVYCWSIKGLSQGIRNGEESFFRKEHINKASVFKGFCEENHDTPLFRLIEVKDYVEKASLEEYSFLYAYRNLCHLLWEEKAILTNNNDIFEKQYNNPVINDIKAPIKSRLNEISKALSMEFDFGKYENLKKLFEKFIVDDGTVKPEFIEEFEIFIYQIDKELLFASMACKELLQSKYPISFGILPEFQNKPNIFYIIAHEEDSNIFSQLVEYSKNSEFFRQNIVLKCTSNTILHPKLYKKLCSTGEIKNLYNFISSYECLDFNNNFGFNFFDV
ncbi:hypothetical protein [Lancefieldella rimae]|uniref:hypothetical protein n=1 Tax=Lancefieldella rimae TaxID=1383 RepID=UPI002880982B|nr:hypothetical protein [Lancefieldella rimae]